MLPQATLFDQGYKGRVYQTHAVATEDFISLGKEKVEGTILAAGPMLVIDEIPDSNPTKKVAQAYIATYERKFGAEAGDVRRQYLGRRDPARACAARGADGRQARDRGIPKCVARCASSRSARSSGLPGVFNMSAQQSQWNGRTRTGPGHRQGWQIPLACGVTMSRRPIAIPRHAASRAEVLPIVGIHLPMRLTGILLAAGSGARFGGAKLLTPSVSAHGMAPASALASRRASICCPRSRP